MPPLVTHVITRLIRGGAQLTLLNLVKGLRERGIATEIVSGGETGSEGSILEDVRSLGVPVRVLPCLRRDLEPMADMEALLSLARHFRRSGTGIAHLHTSKAGLLGGLAARMAGVPAVLYTPQGHIFAPAGAIPGVTDRPRLRPLFLALRRFAEARADRVVALTGADLEEQVALGLAPREKYGVIHNGVDPAPFEALPDKAEARRLLGLPPDATLVIAVGRLSPEKGQDILLDALGRLRETHPRVQGVLVGDGPLRAALEARAPAGAVHFLGLRKDVPLCLRSADLFVLPSRYEAQGMVVVEAMMAGLPVVAMRVGGVPGILAHGETGLLTSEAELPRDMAALLDDPARAAAMAGAARRHALDHLGVAAMVDRYAGLYAALLEGLA